MDNASSRRKRETWTEIENLGPDDSSSLAQALRALPVEYMVEYRPVEEKVFLTDLLLVAKFFMIKPNSANIADTTKAHIRMRSGNSCEAVVTRGGRRYGCGNAAHSMHHIVPRSLGGRNEVTNLTHLCKMHHGQRHRELDSKSFAEIVGILLNYWRRRS